MNDFIIVGLTSWGSKIGSNALDMAMELSLKRKVLYINRARDVGSIFFVRRIKIDAYNIKTSPGEIIKLNKNLLVYSPRSFMLSINWLPRGFLFRLLNYLNNLMIGKEIFKISKKLGFTNPVLLNDNDFIRYRHLDKWLKPRIYIYYIRDFLTSRGYYKKHGYVEKELIKSVGLVFSNSIYLKDYCKSVNSNSIFIGQGFDQTQFIKLKNNYVPKDIKKIKKPIIGYVGMLVNSRLDIDLICKVAEFHKDKSVVLVGYEDDVFQSSKLHKRNNIYFLGGKSVGDIQYYLRHMDVCFNPQRINELTIGNYPRKIDEYLFLGKPIVAMRTKAMSFFENYIYLAKDHDEFNELIELSLKENGTDLKVLRTNFANEHTWENCIKIIDKSLSLRFQRKSKVS